MDIALKLGADFCCNRSLLQKRMQKQLSTENPVFINCWQGKMPIKINRIFYVNCPNSSLSKALFPIGELTKPEVRAIAKKADLITAEKKDSQGLCFIGKVRLPEFLQQKLQPKEGRDCYHSIRCFRSLYSSSTIPTFPRPGSSVKAYFRYKIYLFSRLLTVKAVGKHQGAHYFTKGQRKGLNVGGTKEALYT